MKPFVRPTSIVAVALFTLFGGGLAQVGCTSGGSTGGKSGKGGNTGEGGGSAQGGSGAEAGGSGEGGSGTATGGKNTGGSKTGGAGGGTATGGSGNETGGSGGTVAMTGGVQGTGTGPCDPATWRPTHKGGINGPSATWGGVNAQGKPYTKETIQYTFKNPQNQDVSKSATIWIPGTYADAKDGEVAITFASGAMTDASLEAHSSKLIAAKYMPPMIYAVDGINWGNASNSGGANIRERAVELVGMFDAIRAKYGKLSMDPKMHGTMGQSTAGAVAFDLAWARPDFFGVAIGASASMVGFMQYLYPYPTNINATNKDKIRVAFDVGECDLVWEDGLIPATCGNVCASGNCICQGCGMGNWVQVNRDVTQKLLGLGYPVNLVIRARGVHNVWTGAIADDLAFAWRGVMCK